MSTLQQRAKDLTVHYFKLAEAKYGRTFGNVPVSFNLTGKTAGIASCNRFGDNSSIRYNAQLLEQEGETFLARTVPHEVAHIVAQTVFGGIYKKVGHGADWKKVMAFFGVDATRCHSYDVSEVSTRKTTTFPVFCKCPTHHDIGVTTYRRMLNGSKYSCKRCKAMLTTKRPETMVMPKVEVPVKAPVKPVLPVVNTPVSKPVVATKAPAVVNTVVTSGGSKYNQAINLYNANKAVSRDSMIDVFITKLGLTKPTATTYYKKIAAGLLKP